MKKHPYKIGDIVKINYIDGQFNDRDNTNYAIIQSIEKRFWTKEEADMFPDVAKMGKRHGDLLELKEICDSSFNKLNSLIVTFDEAWVRKLTNKEIRKISYINQ